MPVFFFELDLEVVSCTSTAISPRSQSQVLTRLELFSLECALRCQLMRQDGAGGFAREQGKAVSLGIIAHYWS